MKVNFLVLGAQKCGTTTLCEIISNHKNITFSFIKETNFWCGTKEWEKEIDNLHKYYEIKENTLYGEGSTSNTLFPYYNINHKANNIFKVSMLPYQINNINIAKSIHEYNPEMKFIYIIRDPIERIKSQYKHYIKRGYFKGDINSCLLYERSLIDTSRYFTQLVSYIDLFGKESILLLDFSELYDNQEAIRNKLSKFLDIPVKNFNIVKNVHKNSEETKLLKHKYDFLPTIIKNFIKSFFLTNKIKTELSTESKIIIYQMLKPEFLLLKDHYPIDFPNWGQKFL